MPNFSEITFDPWSFRDRTSRVFYRNDAVFRGLSAAAWRDSLIATEPTDLGAVGVAGDARQWAGVLRQETIAFYPYERSFAMLRDAALGDGVRESGRRRRRIHRADHDPDPACRLAQRS